MSVVILLNPLLYELPGCRPHMETQVEVCNLRVEKTPWQSVVIEPCAAIGAIIF